ncbi:hypothetical protein ACU8KH_00329 [Lachancea thermotolerans]
MVQRADKERLGRTELYRSLSTNCFPDASVLTQKDEHVTRFGFRQNDILAIYRGCTTDTLNLVYW